jgi:hypothetical protein
MLSEDQISSHINNIIEMLLSAPKQDISLISTFPNERGVYLLWENEELVYVGETGSIQKRMKDLRNTFNHQVRRSIANKHFKNIDGFQLGSSQKKHPEHIEEMLNDFLQTKINVSFLPVSFGRKEVEEAICEMKQPCYNNRERRKK